MISSSDLNLKNKFVIKNLLTFSRDFAAEKHQNQKWGVYSYTEHLNRVEKVVDYFLEKCNLLSYKNILKISAQLHDVVEDTDITSEEISTLFGDKISNIVWCVTDENNSKEAVYQKIKSNLLGAYLKLCDRYVNQEETIKGSHPKYLKKYINQSEDLLNSVRQHQDLKILILALENQVDEMKNMLKKVL